MGAVALDLSRTGRSRFSKALPAPPPGASSDTRMAMPSEPAPPQQYRQQQAPPARKPLPPTRKPLPSTATHSLSLRQPPPPPAKDSPSAGSPSLSPSKDSPMARPSDSSTLPLGSKSPTASGPQSHPAAAPQVQPPSPSDSSPLSSLLSAYSNRDSDSTLRSSSDGGTVSTQELFPSPHSPEEYDVSGVGRDQDPMSFSQPSDVLSPMHVRPEASQETLQAARESAAASEANYPPRQSSTAASALHILQDQQPPEGATSGSAAPAQEPSPSGWESSRPAASAIATYSGGNNTRPVPSRLRTTAQASGGADHEAPGPNGSDESISSANDASGQRAVAPPQQTFPARRISPTTTTTTTSRPSPIARLPTPEYDNEDIKNPVSDPIVSPVSPTSSPELPAQQATDYMGVGTDSSSDGGAFPERHHHQNGSFPKEDDSASGLSAGTPSLPAASRVPNAGPAQFPVRTSSRTVEAVRQETAAPPERQKLVPSPAAFSAAEPEENSQPQPQPQLQSRARNSPQLDPDLAQDGSLVGKSPKLLDEVRDPEPEIFPSGWGVPVPEGFVFDAPPVVDRNYRCLTGHRVMHQSRNIYYPLACQTCGVKDTSLRYTCGTCWLRTCTSCRNSLHRLAGNLKGLMKQNEAILVEELKENQEGEAYAKVSGPVAGEQRVGQASSAA